MSRRASRHAYVAPSAGRETTCSLIWSRMVTWFPFVPFLFILLPMGILYDVSVFLVAVFARTVRAVGGAYDACAHGADKIVRHRKKVESIQNQVLAWKESGSKKPMCTSRSQLQSVTFQTLTYKQRLHQIDLNLPDILAVDTNRRLVHVEPNVTIGELNDRLIELGWTLPVVPELDFLTIGGLIMGGGIETTSCKHGLFQDICVEYEVVLSDGRCVTCSAEENPALFRAIPFSHGTLCFLTGVRIAIVPFKPCLRLKYLPVASKEEAVRVMQREVADDAVDSVEAIMYTLNEGVVMSGAFVDHAKDKVNHMARWYKPWFYKHAEDMMDLALESGSSTSVEYVATKDFFHRHTRTVFWLLEYLVPFGNNVVVRWLFGWSFPPKSSLIKWLKGMVPSVFLDRFVAQDFFVPLETVAETLDMCEKETAIYPLWVCPYKVIDHDNNNSKSQYYVDFGIYGFTPAPDFEKVACQKRMERFVIDRAGFVALYAETELSLDDFNEMMNVSMASYNSLRKELNCETAFPHVYEKISRLGRK